MTNAKTTDQEIESDEHAPLIRGDDTGSSSNYQSVQEPTNESTSDRGILRRMQDISKRAKILLSVTTVSIIALLLYLLVAPSDARDHCVRRGYKVFETPVIPFNTSAVAIYLPQRASGGIVKVSQLSTNDNGAISAHINVSPGKEVAKFTYLVYIGKRETQISMMMKDWYESEACVYIEAEIQVPMYATSLYLIGGPNVEIVVNTAFAVDFVTMSTSQAPIRFLGGWQGKGLALYTAYADLDFSGNRSLHATRYIELYTFKGLVRLDDSSSESIKVSTYEGRVEMRNTTATAWIEPITYSGFVSLQDTRATNITIHTKEQGAIDLDHVTVDNRLIAKTQNGAIHALLDGSQSINAKFETYNGDVNITMPDDFRGYFAVYSSSSANVTIVGNQDIVVDKNLTWKKTGYTKKEGEGSVRLRALYSHVKLVF
ncbi:hypothetical protein BJV82DRAFT_577394 [Fennellomyces sp. T-0311]|nr:hypothetical protein BJV82DRAFT_577394 [Fennellomyces sp. T-0311]